MNGSNVYKYNYLIVYIYIYIFIFVVDSKPKNLSVWVLNIYNKKFILNIKTQFDVFKKVYILMYKVFVMTGNNTCHLTHFK